MFVSSYSTYIDTPALKKSQNERESSTKKEAESFNSKLFSSVPKDVKLTQNLPLNYISNYKALHTKQQLDQQIKEQTQTVAKMKFSKLSAQNSAKSTYIENFTMFSLLTKPKATLTQTPKLDRNLPQKAQDMQKSFQQVKMVNTYVSNENYYRITAA